MEELLKSRHSLAHILAQAVQREIDVNVKLGIGPSIDNGFYYDFLFNEGVEFNESNLKQVEKQMGKIIKENQDFIRVELNPTQAKEIINFLGEEHKLELLEEFEAEGEKIISYYINVIRDEAKDRLLNGINPEYVSKYQKITDYIKNWFPTEMEGKFATFMDMCEGPHVENSKEIDDNAFKLAKIAGAYWRGNEKNPMMTRIYGYAFEDKLKLREYLDFLEEAKKRDHRILGQKLGLYTIDQNVGSGLILWKPNGAFIVNQIKRWFEDVQLAAGYQPIITPHIGKKTLWEQSGHWGFYNEGMFPPIELGQSLGDYQDKREAKESEIYLLKPMNCPLHVSIYKDDIHSYKELPLRYYEFGTVYRFEKKGELGGLTRVRGFTQDDAHIIVSKDGLKKEFGSIVDFALRVLKKFHFNDVKIYASFSDPESDKYVGDKAMWKQAEGTIREILEEKKIDYKEEMGEAAFYGPKIDFKVKDVLGREWQLSTVQFDFNLPERFDMTFVNDKGEHEQPFMIHRALLGSLERFMGVLIENYAGAFPMWLAPTQVRIIPVAEKFEDYANKVVSKLQENGIRAKVDESSDSFSKKIRNGEIEKIPHLLIVGEKEEGEGSVSYRTYATKEQGEMKLEEFVNKCKAELADQ